MAEDNFIRQSKILLCLSFLRTPRIFASWRITLLSGSFIKPEYCVHILSAPEERPKQLYLFLSGKIGPDLQGFDRNRIVSPIARVFLSFFNPGVGPHRSESGLTVIRFRLRNLHSQLFSELGVFLAQLLYLPKSPL